MKDLNYRNFLKKVLFIIPFILFFTVSVCADNANSITVKVGWFFTSENSKTDFSGYNFEYLQAISQFTGWNYQLVHCSFNECLKELADGSIDLLTYTLKTPEREKIYDYSDSPAGQEDKFLVTKAGNNKYAFEDYQNFNGMIVGFMQNDVNFEYFKEFRQGKGFTTVDIFYPDYQAIFDALDQGKVEAAVIGNYRDMKEYNLVAKFGQDNFYFLTTKGNTKIIDGVNNSMSLIESYYPDFQNNLYKKYYQSKNQRIQFTPDEKSYIMQHPKVTIYLDVNWQPLSYWDKKSNSFTGIIPDILNLLSQKSGIEFQYAAKKDGPPDNPHNTIYITSFDYNMAFQNNLLITRPLLITPLLSVMNVSNRAKQKIALPKNSLLQDLLLKLVSVNPIYYNSTSETLEAVRKGDADVTYLNSYESSYFSAFPKYNTLSFRYTNNLTQEICLGISKDSDSKLFTIITKALGNITDSEIQDIVLKETNTAYQPRWIDFIYSNPSNLVIGIIILSVIVCIILFSLFLANKKNRQVIQLNEALNSALVEANKANESKSDFLSRMSHDIRTPLNGIIGMTSLAQKETDPILLAKYLDNVDKSSHFLLGLVNDILDMNKLNSGKMKLHPEIYPYKEFCSYLNAVIQPLCDAKKINFKIVGDPSYYAIVVDKLRFNQIFFNLLSNSVKFTPENGHISFEILKFDIQPDFVYTDIAVKDDGTGISQDFQKKLFDIFEQENTAINKDRNGSGLGLSIVKQLVTLMGGTIEVRSTPQKGSTFTVHLKLKYVDHITEESIQTEIVPKNISGYHILICEDNEINMQIMLSIMNQKGVISTPVYNGEEAVKTMLQSNLNYFDAILMDIRMPVMDGLEATRKIRSLNRADAQTIPIIAMTANAFSEDVQESLNAGMNAHISKPIDQDNLFFTLDKLVRSRRKSS